MMDIVLSNWLKANNNRDIIVNDKYITYGKDLKEMINNKITKIRHDIETKGFIIVLDENIVDDTNILRVVEGA